MKKKLILIRGLGHSGTTILDFFLGTHPLIIGIGEGFRTLRGSEETGIPRKLRTNERHKINCTCDEIVSNCKIWGRTMEYVISNESLGLNEKLSYLLKIIYDEYGNDKIIVDSSQSDIQSLDALKEKYDLKIIFLTRDIRSWVNSSIIKFDRSILKNIFIWNKFYKNFENYLIQNKLDYLKFSYEEFSLETEFITKKISSWLNLNYNDWNFDFLNSKHHDIKGVSWKFDLPSSKSHIAAGNRIRLDKIKRSKITYDFKWIYNNQINFNYIYFLPFLKKNNHFVYSNILNKNHINLPDSNKPITAGNAIILNKLKKSKITSNLKWIYKNKINFNYIYLISFFKKKEVLLDSKIRLRTREELESRRKCFLEICKILDELNIFYFIQGGTLLAARREKKFIEWDWDVEISLYKDDFIKNFDQILNKLSINNFSISKCDKYSTQKIDCYKEFDKETSTFTILSWAYNQNKKEYYRSKINIPEKFLKNPEKISFYDKKFYTPNPIDDYLSYQYGDWRTRKRTANKEKYMTKEFYNRINFFKKLLRYLFSKF